MKVIKISIILFSAILLIGFAESAHALSFDVPFVKTLGEPDLDDSNNFTFKDGNFKFVSFLVDNDLLLPDKWTVEATIVDGSATTTYVKGEWTTKIDGEKTVKITGPIMDFELTADDEIDQQFNFYGRLEESSLDTGTLYSDKPWFIYGYFIANGDSNFSVFEAYLSNGDPRESGQVPEPATMMLLATGMLCMITIRRRRKL